MTGGSGASGAPIPTGGGGMVPAMASGGVATGGVPPTGGMPSTSVTSADTGRDAGCSFSPQRAPHVGWALATLAGALTVARRRRRA